MNEKPADEHPKSQPRRTAGDAESPDVSGGLPPEISSQELLGDRQEVLIRHGEDVYRLRITRNGKLILQK